VLVPELKSICCRFVAFGAWAVTTIGASWIGFGPESEAETGCISTVCARAKSGSATAISKSRSRFFMTFCARAQAPQSIESRVLLYGQRIEASSVP